MDAGRMLVGHFGRERVLIGMIHARALPGSPRAALCMDAVVEQAVQEARRYHAAGFDAVMVENMHDRPYPRGAAGPETIAAMSVVVREVRRAVKCPVGVQVLAAANREALAVALAAGAGFVRVEGFVFAHVADEGIIQGDAAALLRYRRGLGADGILVLADVKKKHAAHALTADVDLAETARAAEFFLADGVVVSGTATGRPADVRDVEDVAAAVSIPTFVGSGVTAKNIAGYAAADGFIVGSDAKRGGTWDAPLEEGRAAALVEAFRRLPPPRRPA